MDISDAENAVLEGQDGFEKWQEEFVATWFEPLRRVMVASVMGSIPPDVLNSLDPAAVAEMDAYLGGASFEE